MKLHGFNGNPIYISKDWVRIYKILISQRKLILEYVMWYQIRLKTYFFFSQMHICYLYVNGSGSITSVGGERANLSAVVYL